MANQIKDTDKGYKALLRSLTGTSKKKVVAKIGIFAGKNNKDGKSIAEYAAKNEFGAGRIPERSFMRSTYDDQYDKARKFAIDYIRNNVLKGRKNLLAKGLSVGAAFLAAQIKLKISKSKSWAAPNSAVTIALKSKRGNIKDTPLINTGAMRNAITWRVD